MQRKRGRPLGSKDLKPRKLRKLEGAQNNIQNENENKGENQDISDNEKDENYEISMNYIFSKKNGIEKGSFQMNPLLIL